MTLLFEEHVGTLVVLHAIFAFATLAVSTHLVFWLWPLLRGRFGNRRAVNRFAVLSAATYGVTLLLGMALYPTYKVRVRGEYLENPTAIHRIAEVQQKARIAAEERDQESRRYRAGEQEAAVGRAKAAAQGDAAEGSKIERAAKIVRWFDIKEHWAALGFLLTLAIAVILLKCPQTKATQSIHRAVFAMALVATLCCWSAAIIGLVTAASHSVAAL